MEREVSVGTDLRDSTIVSILTGKNTTTEYSKNNNDKTNCNQSPSNFFEQSHLIKLIITWRSLTWIISNMSWTVFLAPWTMFASLLDFDVWMFNAHCFTTSFPHHASIPTIPKGHLRITIFICLLSTLANLASYIRIKWGPINFIIVTFVTAITSIYFNWLSTRINRLAFIWINYWTSVWINCILCRSRRYWLHLHHRWLWILPSHLLTWNWLPRHIISRHWLTWNWLSGHIISSHWLIWKRLLHGHRLTWIGLSNLIYTHGLRCHLLLLQLNHFRCHWLRCNGL